ncbi:MAG TPA: hypothetical protein VD794_07195 [Flavisolibacter sp.]|nr:hypothetical protein [Flavisolibacter sp.]
MTLYEFKLLADTEQLDILYKQGVYIGKRKQGEEVIVLYQLEGFYVELYYIKYRCYIRRMHCFHSTLLLDPYLENINVEHWVNE